MSKSPKKMSKALIREEVGPSTKIAERYGSNVYVVGKTEGQKKAIEAVRSYAISVLHGVAGTGKTHIAVGLGLQQLIAGKCNRLILTRPYVEAGEHLGLLPGGFNSKIAPFMYPVIDIANTLIGSKAVEAYLENGNIQALPLAYMRGVTFTDAFVVADEMQNSTIKQMRLLLTRIGENSKIVITGDVEQSDLERREKNGLADAIARLQGVQEITFRELSDSDCVRSPLVTKIDKEYRR